MAAVLMTRETWNEYVQRITRGIPRKEVAKAAGVSESRLSRWLDGGTVSAEKAVKFARGIGQPPVEALVHAGFLEPSEADAVIEVNQSVSALLDDELVCGLEMMLAEVNKRLVERAPRGEVDDITEGLSPPDDDAQGVEDDS